MNARRSSSKANIIMGSFLALIRRVLGQAQAGTGDLYLISQLHNRIDCIAREMSTQVRYHVCHYVKTCPKCSSFWMENSETPEPRKTCPVCAHVRLITTGHRIEVWHYVGMNEYKAWKLYGMKSYYRHYIINNVSEYFAYYDTLQWDNLLSDFY